jgi:hypothetical protein
MLRIQAQCLHFSEQRSEQLRFHMASGLRKCDTASLGQRLPTCAQQYTTYAVVRTVSLAQVMYVCGGTKISDSTISYVSAVASGVCVCVCVCVCACARARPTEGCGTPLTPEHMNLRSVLHYSSDSAAQTDAPTAVRDTSHAALTELLAN